MRETTAREMPGRKRRLAAATSSTPAGEPDIPDATAFLDAYFAARRLPVGGPPPAALAMCVRRAERAREDFKRMRAPDGDPAPLRGAPGDAEKYSRRLRNNRKSAAATKVYKDVLAAEQAHTLAAVADEVRENWRRVSVLSEEAGRLRAIVRALRETEGDGKEEPVTTEAIKMETAKEEILASSPITEEDDHHHHAATPALAVAQTEHVRARCALGMPPPAPKMPFAVEPPAARAPPAGGGAAGRNDRSLLDRLPHIFGSQEGDEGAGGRLQGLLGSQEPSQDVDEGMLLPVALPLGMRTTLPAPMRFSMGSQMSQDGMHM